MSLIGKLNYTEEKNTIDILSQIWNSIASTIEIFEGKQLDVLSEFTSKLLSATQPEKIQDDTFFSVCTFFLLFLYCIINLLNDQLVSWHDMMSDPIRTGDLLSL